MQCSHSVIIMNHSRHEHWFQIMYKIFNHFITYSNSEIVWGPFMAQRLSRADCKTPCEPGRQRISMVDFRGTGRPVGLACFVYTSELSQFKECSQQPHQVLYACGHAALTYTAVISCLQSRLRTVVPVCLTL